MPRVSIIIPAYNAMSYIPETMASVLQQTYTDFEVLIVDDGSTDQLVQWVSQLKDPRIKLTSQDNQGASVARNTGIAQAKGEYIAFLDADDLWSPTKLEKQVGYLNSHPEVGLVYTWTALIDHQGKPTGTVWAAHEEGYVWERMVVIDGMISNGSVPMVRKYCLDQVGGFDPNLEGYQDRDMWIRIAAHYPFGVVKEVLNFYRLNPNGMANNSNRRMKMLRAFRKVIEKAFETAPFDSLYLRNRSYAHMALYQGWKSLESDDYKEAIFYRQQVLLHYPQLRYTKDFIYLALAILLTRWLGPYGHKSIRNLKHILHRFRLLLSGIRNYSLISG